MPASLYSPLQRLRRGSRLLLPALSMLATTMGMAAQNQDTDRQAAIDARYRQERAACESGKSTEDRATCLREAAAARDAARQGELQETQENYRRNALARCNALPAADQEICRRRVQGGTVEGSVRSGGIIREYREFVLPGTTPQSASQQQEK